MKDGGKGDEGEEEREEGREAKIPSEMEVALRYTLLALFTLFTLFTLFIPFKLLCTAKTVARMPIYIVKRLECCWI